MSKFFLLLPLAASVLGCQQHEELPEPPINLLQIVPQGAANGSIQRSRGVMEMYLTTGKPSATFWNDLQEQKDPWGTITLKDVEPDGTVVVDFSGLIRDARFVPRKMSRCRSPQ